MHDPTTKEILGGVTHVIIVAYCLAAHYYSALVSLLFGTVIPTSFNILMEIFLHLFHWFFIVYLLAIQCSLHVYKPGPILLLVVM